MLRSPFMADADRQGRFALESVAALLFVKRHCNGLGPSSRLDEISKLIRACALDLRLRPWSRRQKGFDRLAEAFHIPRLPRRHAASDGHSAFRCLADVF